MRADERDDPDTEEYGDGLFGRVLASAPRLDSVDADLTGLFHRDGRTLIAYAVKRAGERRRPDTGTDDLVWAACHHPNAVSILRVCGVERTEVLRRLPSTTGEATDAAPPLTEGLRRVLMVADHLAHQSGEARPGVPQLITALLTERGTRAHQLLTGMASSPSPATSDPTPAEGGAGPGAMASRNARGRG